jgi:hypothetical protein
LTDIRQNIRDYYEWWSKGLFTIFYYDLNFCKRNIPYILPILCVLKCAKKQHFYWDTFHYSGMKAVKIVKKLYRRSGTLSQHCGEMWTEADLQGMHNSNNHDYVMLNTHNPNLYSNMTSFFRFVNKRAIYRLGIISLAHAPVHVTDFPIVNVHVDELSSASINYMLIKNFS